MVTALTLHYDPDGDILYLDKCPPYAEQDSDMVAEDVVARLNPQTGEIETLELLFFLARLRGGHALNLAVNADLAAVVAGLQHPMAAE